MVFAANYFGDDESGGLAGPMGLLVVVLLLIATVLLIRNMNSRLRRLPDSFPAPQPTQREAEIVPPAAESPAQAGTSTRMDVDPGRSTAVVTAVDDEVTAVTTEGDGSSAASDAGRV